MRARLILLLVVAFALVPSVAWAGRCVDGGAERFQQIVASHGALVAVLASFGFGFLASLTPCVYPMVPITVSIFGATGTERPSRARGAALSATFVLGIATLFTPMGVISALSGKLMGSALSSPWLVLALALLFGALAASMFGAFELSLPAGLTNRLSTVGGVGYRGAFAMGLVMGLIAAPCTGPFLTGLVTVIATTKDVALGTAALFSFALGLGVIFFVAGAFGANLPKGGAWMVGIKWVSGVLLGYMAFAYLREKFAPIRRLVDHPSYGFAAASALVLVVGVALGTVHVLAERRNSRLARWSRRAKIASLVPAVAGTAMLLSWFGLAPPDDGDPNVPAIAWLTNEEEALAKARAEGKPVVIDFGAHWCDGCRRLDKETFPSTNVRKESQRFVPLRIDLSDDNAESERIRQKYGIGGLPVLLFLDKRGNEVERLNDFVRPAELVAAMKCSAPSRTHDAVGLR
jgi:thioredoxin:protein disulfide reductase